MNPFMSYRPVSGESFCGREAQLEALVQAARAGRPAAVAGRIGRGVSSMALQTVSRLRAAGLEPVLVDLSDLADEGDLDGRLPSAPGPGATGLHLVVDDADRLTAGGPAPAARAALEEVAGGPGLLLFGHDREALGRLAGGPDLLELELAPLTLAAWLPHALERFLETEVWVANEHVERVYELVGGHPRYLQEASRELWDLAAAGRRVEAPMVQEAVDRVAAREARAWRELWGRLGTSPLRGGIPRGLGSRNRLECPARGRLAPSPGTPGGDVGRPLGG